MAQTHIKKRNWAFVVYPESLPENWLDILKLKGLMTAISPLHDMDKNPTGEVKKAHYHIILSYGNPTTYNNVLVLTKELNGTIPIPLESVTGMYRYLTHKDNPEKHQYKEEDIILLNGFDPVTLLSDTECFQLLKQCIILIKDNHIYQFEDLEFFLLSNDLSDMFNITIKYCYFIQQVLASRRCIKSIKEKNSLTTSHNYSNVNYKEEVEK